MGGQDGNLTKERGQFGSNVAGGEGTLAGPDDTRLGGITRELRLIIRRSVMAVEKGFLPIFGMA